MYSSMGTARDLKHLMSYLSRQNFIKINEQYRELFKANESMNTLYKEYIDHFRKLNQQWIQHFWSPFLTQAQIKETEKIQEKNDG